jgi:hypothetical protein
MMSNSLNSPIFVTGIERSGSSIIAKIISSCGAFTGMTTEMCENIQIKKMLDSYYELLGADKRGQHPLPDTKTLPIPENWGQQVKDILTEEPWMLKGSRLLQTWPVWYNSFPDAKWILVRRRTPDIIDSCMKTGYMKAYKDKEGWLGWIHEQEKMFIEMIEAGVNCKQVWPERMATGDYRQMKETVEWVGLTWDDSLIEKIERMMWNSKQRKG